MYHSSILITMNGGLVWPPNHLEINLCDFFLCFRFLWPCIVNVMWRERTNKKQLIQCLLSNFLSQHVLGIITPIITRIRPCPTSCGVLPGCVGCGGCGLVELRHEMCALCYSYRSTAEQQLSHSAHGLRRSSTRPQPPQPTHPGRTPHAVGHGLILLMMGIMMPETCWDRKFDNKHWISCILLVLSLHLFLWFYKLIELMAMVIKSCWKLTTALLPMHYHEQGCHIGSLGARRATCSKVQPENSRTLGVSTQNLITVVTWRTGLANPMTNTVVLSVL